MAIAAVLPGDVPKGYGLFIPEWEFQTPEGENITIKGTIQEAYAALGSLNPQAARMNGFDLGATSDDVRSGVEKRATFPRVDCQTFEEGQTDAYDETIKYLRGVKGKPKNSAGPRESGRVSCSWRSATFWCNDDTKPKELSSFGEIADGVAAIYKDCTDTDLFFWFSSGEAYTSDDWSVQYRWAQC
ncbi:hypothetical protein BDP55DRAFT_727328 [Colletotrichum godetiae]|uniref:Uncharacterized protein n=1 Tax=Colletotrichum godetiae TaxID=1209918 RepID=A0AAJ0ARC3_9PEZI|nr:uncharacterized protein BDP55DRAFT_727328 [Colletotrichum godetiae]KAK1687380.1 hypothetical protein BDP55DRAFT_727328 [Colletotrichum godetiae]